MMNAVLIDIRNLFERWKEISGQRRDLREHGDTLSKDMGIRRAILDYEAGTVDSFHRG